MTVSLVDNTQNLDILSTRDNLRPNFYLVEIGLHLYDKNKQTMN